MKKALVIITAVMFVIACAGCSKPKLTKEAHAGRLKAKMYDLDRKMAKAEKKINTAAKTSKKEKARAAKARKDLETMKADLEAMKQRLDAIAAVTAEAWDGFTSSLEAGMDKLSNNIETILGAYREQSLEETQPQ